MSDYTQRNNDLLKRVAQGDITAKNQLILENTGLVHSVVKRFLGRGHEPDDLFQIGCIGLIKATQKFDCSFGVKFSTYAIPMIIGEIKRFIRDDGIIKVSRSLKETAQKAMTVRTRLIDQKGIEPSLKEVADELKISPADLASAIDASIKPESLYASSDKGDKEGLSLIEKLENGTCYENEIVNRLVVRQLMTELNPRDRNILYLRYFKQKTQSQIAQLLGISQVQVSRIEKKLLLTLREKLSSS